MQDLALLLSPVALNANTAILYIRSIWPFVLHTNARLAVHTAMPSHAMKSTTEQIHSQEINKKDFEMETH